jgi:mono/diheme cytochrome c family protein
MKVLGLVGILLVTAACNNTTPTATTYKEQLGAPAAVAGNNNTGNAGAVDPAAGQAALAASCNTCHVDGGLGRVLTAAEAESIEKGGPVTSQPVYHSNLQATFDKDGANMAAYLKGDSTGGSTPAGGGAGDATAGEALLKANCEICHNPAGGGLGPALDEFSDFDGQVANPNPSHNGLADYFTKGGEKRNNIEAALKAK